jgi:tripartite-type tricarboxylate transporter receptor subunit TctC
MKRMVISIGILAILLVTFFPHPYCWCAEDPSNYPSKSITFIVGFGPGGGADLTSRQLSEIAEKILKTPIVVENRAGGGGVIGINAIAKSPPDGYTIGSMGYNATIVLPHLRELPYKTKEDFEFVMQFVDYLHWFVVRKDAPWKTFKDFIEDARKKPGEISVNYPGARLSEQIFIERVAAQEKIKLSHVPYRSNAEQITSILGGHTNAAFAAAVGPHIESGSLRALAVEANQRIKRSPEVPTFKELGYKFEKPRWTGIVAPKGVHKSILKKLEDAYTQAFYNSAYQELVGRLQMVPVYRSGEDFKKKVFEDFDQQGQFLKTLGLLGK